MRKRTRIFSIGLGLILALTVVSPMLPAPAHAQNAAMTVKQARAALVDINTATVDQLQAVPGLGATYAKRIVGGRPYTSKRQLVTRGILPQDVYAKVKGFIIAHHIKK